MKPTIAKIIAAVACEFNVRADEITGPRLHSYITGPRFAVCSIARDAGYSLNQIGAGLGYRDHSTIATAIKRNAALAVKDPVYAEKCKALSDALIGRMVTFKNWKFKSIRSAA